MVTIIMGGSGTRSNRQGFADYNDLATQTTPITLLAATWTTMTNDGLGPNSNDTYLPAGTTQLMDTSTGAIDVSELELGDVLHVRNDFVVTQSANNSTLEARYSLGTGGGAYTLEHRIDKLDSGTGITYRYSLYSDIIYMGDANTRDNPITIQLQLSNAGTVVNNGTVITVVRRS